MVETLAPLYVHLQSPLHIHTPLHTILHHTHETIRSEGGGGEYLLKPARYIDATGYDSIGPVPSWLYGSPTNEPCRHDLGASFLL